ncbi:HAMP domain-containing sensor histidine kinase [Lysinibacillus irui]|uniref:histidine kinase n=1 Tax=Lysinibacillus irui TaxID=2998077 RepID=A0ABU5NNZ9_9BACI|nr:HAMP domain-containing sensor histidine kinase [Lysinibacillus irui]MEA0555252.1 HAMP domain-containing sensor histidine kinase [Lysinibacillus irui]MEA0977740.1 HAMP domain-containing sensor histidine kinase [Lysinibacillus irui]MEA1043894.1 HAMP domain-containing sensor histidine kinase [Lysinibacillus irui]
MKRGIVYKLFLLTTMLCVLILATIFVGQTIFFKQFYINKKVGDLESNLTVFEKEYQKNSHDMTKIQQLVRDFTDENNAWITILDQSGHLKHEDDFYIEVQLHEDYQTMVGLKTIKVPLYVIDGENPVQLSESLLKNSQVNLIGILKESQLTPIEMIIENETYTNPNLLEKSLTYRNNLLYKKIGRPREKLKELYASNENSDMVHLEGKIISFQFPQSNNLSIIYSNLLFLEQIKDFQNKILLNELDFQNFTTQQSNYVQNDIKYKILITKSDETNSYIFSMASLQPVDEAVQMIEEYYIYIVAFVFILILLASFYYSVKIAKPLLRINRTTEKIANLDFSETIAVHSQDEIGDLSRNINVLSNRLSMYIDQLQQDIEKEKKLENTRKEFISGVSHELKTPISIMKSCITILRGNVANHKKEYYFDALEQEVDKMDLLIIDMLELAKYESGTYKMQMDAFYIHSLLEEICQKLMPEIEQKQLRVETHLLQIEVVANQRRIEQVLMNFLTNAIRYSPAQESIIVAIEAEGKQVRISVENKGAQIEKDHLEKIWERFYRIDASRKRSEGGTGLGLAISKNILMLHGVEYGVCNTSDGVEFYFYLPIKE